MPEYIEQLCPRISIVYTVFINAKLIFKYFLLSIISDFDSAYNSYIVIDSVPKTDIFNIKLRDKRDVSNPIPSIGKNETNQTPLTLDSSQHLLGVNGTGQRKDMPSLNASTTTPSNKSEPMNNATKKSSTLLNSAIPTTIPDEVTETIVDEIDVPEENINKTIANQKNLTLKLDYYNYYNTTTSVNKDRSLDFWSNIKNFTVSQLLSSSHRRAIVSMIVYLSE